jgi:hypothetical protein
MLNLWNIFRKSQGQTDREALSVKCQIHTELYTKEIGKPYLNNLREFTTNTHTNREAPTWGSPIHQLFVYSQTDREALSVKN